MGKFIYSDETRTVSYIREFTDGSTRLVSICKFYDDGMVTFPAWNTTLTWDELQSLGDTLVLATLNNLIAARNGQATPPTTDTPYGSEQNVLLYRGHIASWRRLRARVAQSHSATSNSINAIKCAVIRNSRESTVDFQLVWSPVYNDWDYRSYYHNLPIEAVLDLAQRIRIAAGR